MKLSLISTVAEPHTKRPSHQLPETVELVKVTVAESITERPSPKLSETVELVKLIVAESLTSRPIVLSETVE